MTNIDICNMALGYLNVKPIMSLDEMSEPARKCRLYYDHLRRKLLRDYPWGFAKKLLELARVDEGGTPNRRFMYAYPNDCISIVSLYDKKGNRYVCNEKDIEKYETFLLDDNSHVIGCDLSNAMLEYVADVRETAVFSADFTDALSHLLASTLATSLVSDQHLQQLEYQLFQLSFAKAKASDAREREFDHNYPDSYMRSRL